MLADGKKFKLQPNVTQPIQEGDPCDHAIHQARHREELTRERAREALDKGELYVHLTKDEMNDRLVTRYTAHPGRPCRRAELTHSFLCWGF
ncbi:hypothetical protein DFAR_340015 [Desulfarculales bacterium]